MTVTDPAGQVARPYLHGTETDAVAEVLASGQWTHGPQTEAFEAELAAFLGVADVVAVATGTAALHLALLAAGASGGEVIVPSLTFAASVQAILAAGARPRFCEADPHTLSVTADTVAEAITDDTVAIMPVLYGGRAVDLSPIASDLAARDITIIEDAAHAFGSWQGPHRVGATGRLTCFSFDPIKNLTCGDGGAVVPAQAAHLRELRGLGITATSAERATATGYEVTGLGLRAHLGAINAAIGRAQLAGFEHTAGQRQRLWRTYRHALAGIDGLALVDVDVDHTVPFNCVVRIEHGRDRVHAALQLQGIAAGVHYPPNHAQPAFRAWQRPLPVTERLGGQILTLPLHPAMSEDDVHRVAGAVRAVLSSTTAVTA